MKQARTGGFTLTEVAIVLGIIGLVLGGVWLASASVNEKRKVQDGAEMVLQIASNVENVYVGHRTATAPSLARQISMGIFPAGILNANETQTVNPWGGEYTLYFANPLYGFSVSIELPTDMAASASREACIALFTRLRPTGPAQGGGPLSANPAASARTGGGQEDHPVAAYVQQLGGWIEATNDSATDLAARFTGTAPCRAIAFYFPL